MDKPTQMDTDQDDDLTVYEEWCAYMDSLEELDRGQYGPDQDINEAPEALFNGGRHCATEE